MRVTRHHARWVPPFGHPRITARLAAPRGLSQPTTSFIGSWCQGIHRVLLHTYNTKQLKMLASTVQFSNNTHQPHPHHPHRRHIGNQRQSETTVLSQTPNSVLRLGFPSPRKDAGPEPTPRRSPEILRDSVPPNERVSRPTLGTETAHNSDHTPKVRGECSLERR